VRAAKSYDPANTDMNWERGFKKLSESRDPSKQPNNKSLLIFNLNIWYLYSHIMKGDGELKSKADEMIKEGVDSVISLNMSVIKKQYEQKTLQKLVDICADIPGIRSKI